MFFKNKIYNVLEKKLTFENKKHCLMLSKVTFKNFLTNLNFITLNKNLNI